jgi:hypothetical protein
MIWLEPLMILFFTTAKPISNHSGIIQRNALTSWKALDPEEKSSGLGMSLVLPK